MLRKEITEREEALARELGRELAEKTQASLINPSDAVLGERIREIRKQINELGLEIRCSRIVSVNLKDPNDTKFDVEVTLYFPPPVN